MILVVKTAFLIVLFIFIYLFVSRTLHSSLSFFRKRARLVHFQGRNGLLSQFKITKSIKESRLYKHLETLIASTHAPLQTSTFANISIMLTLLGIIAGYFTFSHLRGLLLLTVLMGASPYLLLRMQLLNIQMRTRLEFLPAVEVFYQHYVLSYHKNARVVLGTIIKEQSILFPMRPVFEQLHRNLAANVQLDQSLKVFNMTLGHIWGEYFSNILRLGIAEGVDMTTGLYELIEDMRRAKRSDQLAKNRLLEIRIANFSPLLFLAIFLFINFKINGQQAYYYYIVQPEGRQMLLDAMFMIFLSFIMGVVLSIRRM